MRIESIGVGGLIALLVIVLAVVFMAMGTLPLLPGVLIAALGVARLT